MMELDNFKVEKVWDGAIKLLTEIGLKIENKEIKNKISKYLKTKNERVIFSKEIIENFKNEITKKTKKFKPQQKKFTITNTRWCSHYVEPETQQIKPFDTSTLISYTKLICQLRNENLIVGGVAGYPLDVPPPLQFISSYYIDCCYNSAPSPLSIAHTKEIYKFILEISKIMEFKPAIGTEPISPLTFTGNSINIAVEFFNEKPTIGIDPMPIMGITAPLDWHAAWAQSVAENLGSYIIFRLYGFENVEIPSFRLFLPNMTSGMIYFSSPKQIFALLTRRKVRKFFNLDTDACELMLISSKLPDQQAAIEKTTGCLLAKLNDFYYIEGAGALSLDEIFSPQQVIVDIEIKNFVENVEAEIEEKNDIIEIVEEGIKSGSFLPTTLTFEKYEKYTWRPILFDLSPRTKGQMSKILTKANQIAEEKIKKHDYELTGSKREELEKIMEKARKELI